MLCICMHNLCYLRPENECVSETKYLKYQQNIEGNSRFGI